MFDNKFITGPESLITTKDARRAGFLEVALRRNEESIPYLDQAKTLYARIIQETTVAEDILNMTDCREAFLEAAGYSQKTKSNLSDEDKDLLLKEFVEKILKSSGVKYADEIVYRYLMSLGEQLGGRMRNIIGVVARGKLSLRIISALTTCGYKFELYTKERGWFKKANYTRYMQIPVSSEREIKVYLNKDGKKKVLTAWQEKKRSTIVHPYLNEKIQLGILPFVQSSLLAKYIRGEIKEYPCYLLK